MREYAWLQYDQYVYQNVELDRANLTQHVSFPTHRHSHTLDLVITSASSTLSSTVISMPISLTDYFPIICSLKTTNSTTAPITKFLTRAIRAISTTDFYHDMLSSRLILLIIPQYYLIFSTAVIQPSLNFSTNLHILSLKSSALNLVIIGLLRY